MEVNNLNMFYVYIFYFKIYFVYLYNFFHVLFLHNISIALLINKNNKCSEIVTIVGV